MNKYIIILCLLVITASCGINENEDRKIDNFNENELLQNLTSNILIPTLIKFEESCQDLETSVLAYSNDMNEKNLEVTRNKWIEVSQIYGSVYAFEIGEARKNYYRLKLSNWPTNGYSIEGYMDRNTTINESIFKTFGKNGLPDIEYLLFSNIDLTETNNLFKTSGNRMDYLKLLILSLVNDSKSLHNLWDINGENYLGRFLESNETGLNNSFNMLFNGINNLITVAFIKKIEKPFKTQNKFIVQTPYGRVSKEILTENINIVEELFFTNTGLNISAYLMSKTGNNDLNNSLRLKLNECKEKINNINTPLVDAIRTEKDGYEELISSFNKLSMFLAVDISFAFNTTITSVDVDGD